MTREQPFTGPTSPVMTNSFLLKSSVSFMRHRPLFNIKHPRFRHFAVIFGLHIAFQLVQLAQGGQCGYQIRTPGAVAFWLASHLPFSEPPQGPFRRLLAHLVTGQMPPVSLRMHMPHSWHCSMARVPGYRHIHMTHGVEADFDRNGEAEFLRGLVSQPCTAPPHPRTMTASAAAI